MERLDGVVRWRSIRPARSRPSPPPRGRRHGAPSKRTTMNQNDTAVATDPAQEDASFLLTPPPTATTMRVNKRSGDSEPVDLNKIVRAVQRCAERSEEHTSELQSLMRSSYAVFCLKKKKNTNNRV